MPPINLPPNFSALPIVLKVEQRFGLGGFAHLVKLLELFAVSPSRDAGLIELSVSDWHEALQTGPAGLPVFLAYLEAAGWLTQEQDAEPGAPLRVTLSDFAAFLPVLELPRVANDWRLWFTAELSMPDAHAKDPYTQALFRRWCATNVTLEEMNAAVELAIQAGAAPTPSNLHNFLMTVRKDKLERARR